MSAHALGLRLGLERARSRLLGVGAVLAVSVVVVVALLERAHEQHLAVDRALSGAAFGLCLPLFCYGWFELAAGRASFASAVSPLARHGQPRPALAFGFLVGVGLICAGVGALLAGLAVLFTRDFAHARFASDLVSVLWIGGLTGAAYAGLFALGSGFRRGRSWLLVLDWLLGSGTGLLAAPWPRGHARNLLGFEPVLELSQPSAVFALLALVAAGFFAATRSVPR